ncbi:hypothetical protein ACEPAI_4102 [Sanghuangporus weigelae]
MFSNLDIDVLLHIFSWLHAKDILSLRKTSRRFNEITRLRIVWHNALTNLLADNLPIASVSLGANAAYPNLHTHGVHQDFSSLSAEELEAVVLSTCRQTSRWEQRKPMRTRSCRLHAHVGRVFLLRFLRLQSSLLADQECEIVSDGRYLLSFGHTAAPTLCMQVWDLDAEGVSGQEDEQQYGGRSIAEWGVNGRVIGLAVDEGNGLYEFALENNITNNVVGSLIALSARDFDVPGAVVFAFRILLFAAATPSGGRLAVLKSFPLRGPLNVRAMHGRLMAVQVRAESEGQVFGHGVLKVIDWLRSTEIYVQAPDEPIAFKTGIANSGKEFAVKLEPSVHGMNRAVLRVQFVHDWVLVFRESVLELYFLPPSLITNTPHTIYPNAFHKWNFQINTLTVTERISWVHDRMGRHCRLCDSQGTVFAPVEVAGEIGRVNITCACRYRPLSIVARFDSYYPWPVNLLHHFVLHVSPHHFNTLDSLIPEVPYMLPPQMTQTIPSVVRLFGHSVLVLGRYGTLVWTDSEANNSEEAQGSTQAYFAEGTGERVAGRRLRLPPSPDYITSLASEPAAPQEPDPSTTEGLPSSTPGQGMQTSVFSTRLTEGWYSVALSESRGRIAIGDGEGVIELWDHF